MRRKVLVVEDDKSKSDELVQFITLRWLDVDIVQCGSYQSGVREALRGKPDGVVLDMAIPKYDVTPEETGGPWREFGGRDILRQMKRKRVSAAVVVVTHFTNFGDEHMTLGDLDLELAQEFPDHYLGAIYYHRAEIGWRIHFKELLEMALRVAESKS